MTRVGFQRRGLFHALLAAGVAVWVGQIKGVVLNHRFPGGRSKYLPQPWVGHATDVKRELDVLRVNRFVVSGKRHSGFLHDEAAVRAKLTGAIGTTRLLPSADDGVLGLG